MPIEFGFGSDVLIVGLGPIQLGLLTGILLEDLGVCPAANASLSSVSKPGLKSLSHSPT